MSAKDANAPAAQLGAADVAASAELALMQFEIDALIEARDEINRELQVRERCFPRWITEGRISGTDARDRIARQKLASKAMDILLDLRRRDL